MSQVSQEGSVTATMLRSGDSNGSTGRASWPVWLVVIATIVIISAILPSVRRPAEGLTILTAAAARIAQGDDIYAPGNRSFTYPPFSALPLAALEAIPQSVRRATWYAVNLLSLVLIAVIVFRRLESYVRLGGAEASGEAWKPPLWLFGTVFVLLTGRHILAPIENEQFDLLLMLMVVASIDLGCVAKETRSGIFAGLAAATKATPLLFAPVYFWQRRWKAFGATLAAAALFTLLPDLLFPSKSGELWVVQWFNTYVSKVRIGETAHVYGAWTDWNLLNQSLAGTVYRLLTPDPPHPGSFDVSLWAPSAATVRIITLAMQIGIVAWLCLITRPSLMRGANPPDVAYRRFGEGAAVVAAMLLLSPMSSKAHFCVLALPIAFCLVDFCYRRRDWFVGGMLLFQLVVGTATAKDIVGRDLGAEILARGSVTWCTLAALLGTGWILIRRSTPAETCRKS